MPIHEAARSQTNGAAATVLRHEADLFGLSGDLQDWYSSRLITTAYRPTNSSLHMCLAHRGIIFLWLVGSPF